MAIGFYNSYQPVVATAKALPNLKEWGLLPYKISTLIVSPISSHLAKISNCNLSGLFLPTITLKKWTKYICPPAPSWIMWQSIDWSIILSSFPHRCNIVYSMYPECLLGQAQLLCRMLLCTLLTYCWFSTEHCTSNPTGLLHSAVTVCSLLCQFMFWCVGDFDVQVVFL